MAVDESNLELMIRSLEALEATWRSRIDRVRRCRETLLKIQRGEGSTDNPEDPDTGATMSQARRDEIYDACLPNANALLGIEDSGST